MFGRQKQERKPRNCKEKQDTKFKRNTPKLKQL